jgi:predicted XRE-type DNA-binding protein
MATSREHTRSTLFSPTAISTSPAKPEPELPPLAAFQTIPDIFQRLERVKERLALQSRQHYLDTSRKAWYVQLTATYLAQHLLEAYRRQVEETVGTKGLDALAPHVRRFLTGSTTVDGHTRVLLALDATDTANVTAALTRLLETSDQASAWSTMDRRLATDLSTLALEQVSQMHGSTALETMSATMFEETLVSHVQTMASEVLLTRIQHFFTRTAQHVAFDLATTITARTPSLAELDYLLGFRDATPLLTRLQPLLREEHFTVLSAAHYQAVREVLAKNTFQRLEGIPWPTAPLATGPARGHAQLRPVVVDTKPMMAPEEVATWAQHMWQQREALSDLDADALDALSALWLYQARTPQDDAVVDVDELLVMRGLRAKLGGQGRRGGYRPAQRTAMLQALMHIQNLWMNMSEVEVYEDVPIHRGRRRRTRTRQAIQSRAFTITDLFGQMQFDGSLDVQKFIFRPGKVFAHFLFGPGRQTALLSAQALQYDPLRQTWEKRLARYLSYQWRCKAHSGGYLQPFRVATLLDAVGEQVDSRKPSRTRERLEKALDMLHQDRVIATWQYERWQEAMAEQRGWAHHWCHATILIEPPEAIRDTYHHLEHHEASQHNLLPISRDLGDRIRRRRKMLGLSQIQAAEQLGIHQGYFSRLERGKVHCSSTIQERLDRWLAEDPDISTHPDTETLTGPKEAYARG